MKGETTLKILETVGDLGMAISDVFGAILNSGYGASYNKLNYEISKRQSERSARRFNAEEKRRARAKFNSIIYKLKRDNLIIKDSKANGNNPILKLTLKGKSRLNLLKIRKTDALPALSYEKFTTDKFIIIIFDIPEKIRRKRNWLRSALRNLELKMIQKSVWVGKIKLPKTFLEDLKRLELIDFVEIFEITKTGSLKQIT